ATMIYVTHDQHEAMTLADRIVLLNRGHIEQAGPPLELYQTPATRFAAEFMGSPPMNFLPADKLDDGLASEQLRVARDNLDIADWQKLPEQLVVGVRPEALSREGSAPHRLSMQVAWVERTGSDSYVHGRAGETPVVARIGAHQGDDLAPGAQVDLQFSA